MVKQIKELRSELQSIVLFQFEILNGRKVGSGQAESRNDVSSTVSVRTGATWDGCTKALVLKYSAIISALSA